MLPFLGRQVKESTERATERTRRTWFGRVTSLFLGAELDDDFWDELEELLILADVGVGPTIKLLDRLRDRIRAEDVGLPDQALGLLKDEMVSVLTVDAARWHQEPPEPPLVVLMVGVNGSGKTTSIAKMARMYSDEGKHVLLGAADTFRAAAIEQLQTWGDRLGMEVFAHRPGADPGAVAFDTLQAARSRRVDVAIIDTSGRLHTKHNLMEEIKKVQRVLSRRGRSSSVRVLLTIDVDGVDDYSMMREVLTRRFRRLAKSDDGVDSNGRESGTAGTESRSAWRSVPDLVLIDGGKGHLGAALQVFLELGIDDIPLSSLAKENEELFVPQTPEPIVLPRTSQALFLVQRLRDEAHRFAVTFHRQRRSKRATSSAIDDVSRIGPKRRRMLLRRFGSIAGIREASMDEIAAVPGMTLKLAQPLKEYL